MTVQILLRRAADVMRRCDPEKLADGESPTSDGEWDALLLDIEAALSPGASPVGKDDVDSQDAEASEFFGRPRPKRTIEHEGRTFEARIEAYRGVEFVTAIHQLVASSRSPYPNRRKVFPRGQCSVRVRALLSVLGADERGRLGPAAGGAVSSSGAA